MNEARLHLRTFTTFIHVKKGRKFFKKILNLKPGAILTENSSHHCILDHHQRHFQGKAPVWNGSALAHTLRRGEEFKHEWSVFLALSSLSPQHAWLALENCLLQHNTRQKLLTLRFLTEKDWLLCRAEVVAGGTSGGTRQLAKFTAWFPSETKTQGSAEGAGTILSDETGSNFNLAVWVQTSYIQISAAYQKKKKSLSRLCSQPLPTSLSEEPCLALLLLYP